MQPKHTAAIFLQMAATLRIIAVTMGICCVFYVSFILMFAKIAAPESAEGSLIRNADGDVLGSALIAQGFSGDRYLWPRPSAVDYNASSSGGSNLSPVNPELHARARHIIKRLNLQTPISVPADLVTASGSGLDPHITLKAVLAQSERIASVRGLPVSSVVKLLKNLSRTTGGFLYSDPMVNVLDINLALDMMGE